MGLRSWASRQLVDDEQFKKRIQKYGWLHYMFQTSLVNSSYRSLTALLFYYVCLLMVTVILIFHVYCYVSTVFNAYYIGRPDMSVANVHSIVLAWFIFSCVFSYVFEKSNINEIERLYDEKLFEYEDECETPLTLFEVAMGFFGRQGIASGGVFLFMNVYVIAPLIDLRFWGDNCIKSGINFCLALPMFHPYDSDEGWYFILSIAIQALFGMYRINVFCSIQTTLTLWPLHLIRELSILKTSIINLDTRIKKRYFTVTKRKIASNANTMHMFVDEELNKCAKFCLHENVKHHQIILRYFNKINDIMAIPSFLAYMTGTLTMAIAMVKLLSVEGETTLGGHLAYGSVLGAEVGFMILISVMGESVTMLAEDIFDEAGHIRIENYGLEFRKSVLIFMEGTLQPIALSSSKFNKCNMEAFGNVMNAAYSFYNVTNASN